MNKLKLEVGKAYRTRDGQKAIVLEKVGDGRYPLTVVMKSIKNPGIWLIENLTWNGCWHDDGREHGHDLIEEWVEPLDFDWNCLPAWCDKAIAMDSDGKWLCSSKTTPTKLNMCWSVRFDVAARIPPEYAPKNFTGSWEDSLFVNPKYQEGDQ